ncbi:hypothetical protein B0H13DRAFT_2337171 [Mycena leptocephala]|nr:hypothetical protein B0H13DRAFT_2337171 [Mycena leptocephala]
MANPSDDAQFASLYGRFLSGPQGGAPLGGPVGRAPGLASIFTFLPGPLAGGSGFCQPGANTEPCSDLNSVTEYCKKNQGKGPCLPSVSSAIEFCNGNQGTDPCPHIISANEFCKQNPTTGPCSSINSAIASSEFCRQNPSKSPCPGAQTVTQSVGPTIQPGPPSPPSPPPSPTTSTPSHDSPSSGPPTPTVDPSTSNTASQASSTRKTSPTTVTSTSSQLTSIIITAAAGNSDNSPGLSLPPSAAPTLAASPTISPSLAAPSKSHNKAAPIIAGVVVPIVLIILAAAGFILYKRRKRARDRREWERTHAEIADAVRQIGAPVKVAVGPAWSGDLKTAPDGDGDALSYSFEKSGGMESSARLP